ncbi:biotin--[acetyl-CoA-carboxylase] ligase [candidate division KSB1 bacterium]|nr:biotin--[acetyl-CoA-carboxylase] ligase [candidate division KSB1 bacterium]
MPGQLNEEEILRGLKTRFMARSLKIFNNIKSTNDHARLLAENGAPEGTVILADWQSKGKGRMGRSWESAAGKGVWFSIILRPNLSVDRAPLLNLMGALAVYRTILGLGDSWSSTNPKLSLKWPNDVLLDGKKVCGILSELGTDEDRVQYVVVGVGLNINHAPEDFSPAIRHQATSLKLGWESKEELPRNSIFSAVINQFEKDYLVNLKDNFKITVDDWMAETGMIGRVVRLRQGRRTFEGYVKDLGSGGELILQTEGGGLVSVTSGEVDLLGVNAVNRSLNHLNLVP